mmetsp:Transcript_19661/g.75432  ORF Transcript_19661/g.75432 Transcript_19661/m.75432 type:complete len:922 (-) Transcript_19661:22-2787(-)
MVEASTAESAAAREEAKAKSKKRSESAKKARATREKKRQRREYLVRKQAVLYELRQSSVDSGTESFPYLNGTTAADWQWPQTDDFGESHWRAEFAQRFSPSLSVSLSPIPNPSDRLLQVEEVAAEPGLAPGPLAPVLFPSPEPEVDLLKLELPQWATDSSVSPSELSSLLAQLTRIALDPTAANAPLDPDQREALLAMLPDRESGDKVEDFLSSDNQVFGQTPLGRMAEQIAGGRCNEDVVWAHVAAEEKAEISAKRARCEYKLNLMRSLAMHKHEMGFEDQEEPYLHVAFAPSNTISHVGLDHLEDSDTDSEGDREYFPDGSRKAAEGTLGLMHFTNVDGTEESIDADFVNDSLSAQLSELREEKTALLMAKSGKGTRRTRRRSAKKQKSVLSLLEGEEATGEYLTEERGSSRSRGSTGGGETKKRKRETEESGDTDSPSVSRSPAPKKKKRKSTPRPSPAPKTPPAEKKRAVTSMAGALSSYAASVALKGPPKCAGDAPKAMSGIRRGVDDVREGEEILIPSGPTWALFPAIREVFEVAGKEASLDLYHVVQALYDQFGDKDVAALACDKPLENVVAMALEFLANPPKFPMPSPEEGVSTRGTGKAKKKKVTAKKVKKEEEEAKAEEKVQVVEFSMPAAAPVAPLVPITVAEGEGKGVTPAEAAVKTETPPPKTTRGRAGKKNHSFKFVAIDTAENTFSWIGPMKGADNVTMAGSDEEEEEKQAQLVLDVMEMLFYFALTRGQINEDSTAIDLAATKQQKASTTVAETVGSDRSAYRDLEEERYLVPERPYTYLFKGKEVVVASMKRKIAKRPAKARAHPILRGDRPGHISVLSLVRDAAARLPGGIGTRPDVATLLRDSQYVLEEANEAKLHQVVSGALDRLHAEEDPCVRFYSDQQLWAYLHRRREEANFPTFTGKK